MALFQNDPKNGSKYNTAYIMNWEEINSPIEFSEFRFCKDEDYYYVFAFITKFQDIIKPKEKDWKFSPALYQLQFARKPVAHNGKEPAQYAVEKLVCYALDKLDETKTYKGNLCLQQAGFITTVVDGVDMQGKPVPDAVREQIAATVYSFEETEAKEISAEDVKATRSFKSYGAKAQTEYEKLGDRLKFITDQLKLAGCELEIKSLVDLDKAAESHRTVIDWCVLLMSR